MKRIAMIILSTCLLMCIVSQNGHAGWLESKKEQKIVFCLDKVRAQEEGFTGTCMEKCAQKFDDGDINGYMGKWRIITSAVKSQVISFDTGYSYKHCECVGTEYVLEEK